MAQLLDLLVNALIAVSNRALVAFLAVALVTAGVIVLRGSPEPPASWASAELLGRRRRNRAVLVRSQVGLPSTMTSTRPGQGASIRAMVIASSSDGDSYTQKASFAPGAEK